MSIYAPEGSDIYDYTNPKRFGRGQWQSFIINSLHSDTKEERLIVCKQIRLFVTFCKCAECRDHAILYLISNPPEQAIETNNTLFIWVITFKNSVALRIGKELTDPNIIYKLFTDINIGVCESGCGSEAYENLESMSTQIENNVKKLNESTNQFNAFIPPSHGEYKGLRIIKIDTR